MPKYTITIDMNRDCELPTAVLFFQKILIAVSKYGITYFGNVILRADDAVLVVFETSSHLPTVIKDHNDEVRKRHMAAVMFSEGDNSPNA